MHFGRSWFRAAAVLTLLAFASATTGCWRTVPITEMEAEPGKTLAQNRVRFILATEADKPTTALTMEISKIEYPFARGTVSERKELSRGGAWLDMPLGDPQATVDLRQVQQIEVYDPAHAAGKVLITVVVAVGVTAAIVLGVLLIAVITRTCPMLYVDRGTGMEFAGVPYAGATFLSIQRDDLLPIDKLPSGLVQMKLIDGGLYETDYTDRAELVVVDHAAGISALPTPDARVLLVGAPQAPLRASDLTGRDRLADLRAVDAKVVQTALEQVPRDGEPPVRDGFEATFAPLAGKRVLEVTAGTTPWIDLVFANYAALFGDRLGRYVDRWNAPDKRAEVLAWRDRQGVDLRVELFEGGAWQTVASVPTPGPQRTFAGPLPEGKPGEEVRVRVSGGLGFWAFDHAALAPLVEEAKPVRVPVARAVDKDGKDQREALAANDGKFQVLPETGDQLQLAFEVPPLAAGRERSAFFASSGYYNVRQAKGGSWSPAKLKRIGDGPGALARFSLELFREYQKIAEATARRPVIADQPLR
jgi:hypothetical protein